MLAMRKHPFLMLNRAQAHLARGSDHCRQGQAGCREQGFDEDGCGRLCGQFGQGVGTGHAQGLKVFEVAG